MAGSSPRRDTASRSWSRTFRSFRAIPSATDLWLWAWADPHVDALQREALTVLRNLGELHQEEDLTQAETFVRATGPWASVALAAFVLRARDADEIVH